MLLATLLPDPGDAKGRRRVAEQLAGHLVPKRLRGGEEDPKLKETSGGILHWGRQDGPQLDQFRVEIKEAFGGRPPRVLDPFAGGGAIPLESMRLGCETFASDLNPVAWFILRCTLHYPRLVGREERPLPDFAITGPGVRHCFGQVSGREDEDGNQERAGAARARGRRTRSADI